jgi:NAD(P)-dependent dehydrogenase (short-subunit alcohol dehydrogenase family)
MAADVERMIAAALEAHDHIDILCNNAGVPDLFQGAAECTDEEWDRSLAVNLTGAFLASRLALRHMVQRGSGVIINTGSVASFRGGEAGVAYTAAKHGLIGLTRSIAAMYGPDGIRCVAICPGPVTTGITKLNASRRKAGLLDARGQEMARRTAALRWRWSWLQTPPPRSTAVRSRRILDAWHSERADCGGLSADRSRPRVRSCAGTDAHA